MEIYHFHKMKVTYVTFDLCFCEKVKFFNYFFYVLYKFFFRFSPQGKHAAHIRAVFLADVVREMTGAGDIANDTRIRFHFVGKAPGAEGVGDCPVGACRDGFGRFPADGAAIHKAKNFVRGCVFLWSF